MSNILWYVQYRTTGNETIRNHRMDVICNILFTTCKKEVHAAPGWTRIRKARRRRDTYEEALPPELIFSRLAMLNEIINYRDSREGVNVYVTCVLPELRDDSPAIYSIDTLSMYANLWYILFPAFY